MYNDKDNKIRSEDIGRAFFKSAPKWSEDLFEFRNRVVSVFGLKTSGNTNNRKELVDNFNFEPNEKLGLFKVFDKTENEIILGEDDKHLNFRISLLKESIHDATDKKMLTISTIVKFNNWSGRLYFLPVKPFHRLIVPKMLTGIIDQIEKQGRSAL